MPPRAADPDFTKSRRETAEDDAAARPLTIRSWPEALNAGGFSSACMMASSCDGCPCVFPGWPRLLVAVSFSVSCILQIWWLARMALGLGVTSYGLTSYASLFFNQYKLMYAYKISNRPQKRGV